MNIGQPLEFKCLWDFFTDLSVGQLYPNVEKDAPAEDVAVALLAKFCNGKTVKKIPPFLHDSVDKITISTSKEKIIKL